MADSPLPAYFVARFAGRDVMEQCVGQHPKIDETDELQLTSRLPCLSLLQQFPAVALSLASSIEMAEEGDEASNMEALKRTMQYALIKNCDMNEEMRSDCVDAVISAAEKCVCRAPGCECSGETFVVRA